jgi:hypothetical protein
MATVARASRGSKKKESQNKPNNSTAKKSSSQNREPEEAPLTDEWVDGSLPLDGRTVSEAANGQTKPHFTNDTVSTSSSVMTEGSLTVKVSPPRPADDFSTVAAAHPSHGFLGSGTTATTVSSAQDKRTAAVLQTMHSSSSSSSNVGAEKHAAPLPDAHFSHSILDSLTSAMASPVHSGSAALESPSLGKATSQPTTATVSWSPGGRLTCLPADQASPLPQAAVAHTPNANGSVVDLKDPLRASDDASSEDEVDLEAERRRANSAHSVSPGAALHRQLELEIIELEYQNKVLQEYQETAAQRLSDLNAMLDDRDDQQIWYEFSLLEAEESVDREELIVVAIETLADIQQTCNAELVKRLAAAAMFSPPGLTPRRYSAGSEPTATSVATGVLSPRTRMTQLAVEESMVDEYVSPHAPPTARLPRKPSSGSISPFASATKQGEDDDGHGAEAETVHPVQENSVPRDRSHDATAGNPTASSKSNAAVQPKTGRSSGPSSSNPSSEDQLRRLTEEVTRLSQNFALLRESMDRPRPTGGSLAIVAGAELETEAEAQRVAGGSTTQASSSSLPFPLGAVGTRHRRSRPLSLPERILKHYLIISIVFIVLVLLTLRGRAGRILSEQRMRWTAIKEFFSLCYWAIRMYLSRARTILLRPIHRGIEYISIPQ